LGLGLGLRLGLGLGLGGPWEWRTPGMADRNQISGVGMGMGFAPTWLRQVSPPPLLHKTTLTTGGSYRIGAAPQADPNLIPYS